MVPEQLEPRLELLRAKIAKMKDLSIPNIELQE